MKVLTSKEFSKLSKQEKDFMLNKVHKLSDSEQNEYWKKVHNKEITLGEEARAKAINNEHFLYESAIKKGLAHAMRAGELLVEVKASLEHGEFSEWVLNNCEFSLRTAQNYMRFYINRGELAKAQETALLTEGEMTMEQALRFLKDKNAVTRARKQANKVYNKPEEEELLLKKIVQKLSGFTVEELKKLIQFIEENF